MPYKKISDLPNSVKDHLPKDAQKIYMEVFNSAFLEYRDPSKRRGNTSQDETACRVAWAAVKKQYSKNDKGKWVKT